MIGYLIAGFIGFIIGTVLTCILLCKKNLEVYTQISQKGMNSLSSNFETAKAMYKAQVEAYENGYDELSEAQESESDNNENEEEIKQ